MPGSGKLTVLHTVWCCRCENYMTFPGRKWLVECELPEYGWIKIKRLWHCPQCAKSIGSK